jgi:hypothetical protein
MSVLAARKEPTVEKPFTMLEALYSSYLSTPNFIKKLCELSDELIPLMENKGEQMAYLQKELRKINQKLPASVYIPFVSQSMRNYTVLHIVTEEARIFRTKERAPIMLCIECYRPTEIALEKIPEVLNLRSD